MLVQLGMLAQRGLVERPASKFVGDEVGPKRILGINEDLSIENGDALRGTKTSKTDDVTRATVP
jgi:hypothetical protein